MTNSVPHKATDSPPSPSPSTNPLSEAKSIYTEVDLKQMNFDPEKDLGLPGQYPFTRGITPDMHTKQPWIMGQYSGYSSPQETNQRIRSLIQTGQKGFSIALDLPTQIGLDSDDPMAIFEVGQVGVPIDSLADMEELLEGIPLDQVTQIRTTANSIGPIMLAFFIAAAEKRGYSPNQFRVMFQNDVLKEYLARGTYIFPPEYGLKFSVDVIEYCARNLPHWEPIEFCGYHIRDSGATAVQESAIAIANGIIYINSTLERGLRFEDFGKSLVMFLCAGPGLFEEVAKFRATRRIWARLIKQHFGVQDNALGALKIFSYTLGSPLTADEPLNNVIRVTLESLAAVLGGVQTLASSSYDEALGLPSDEAALLALRTQQILAYESGITQTADPLGGAYFLEALTHEFEQKVVAYLELIDSHGGALKAFESGWLSLEIENSAYTYHRQVESGERPVIGVNRFTNQTVSKTEKRRIVAKTLDADIGKSQAARLAQVRATRDADKVNQALLSVEQAAKDQHNTIPSILEAVRAYATIGEITTALKRVWGAYKP